MDRRLISNTHHQETAGIIPKCQRSAVTFIIKVYLIFLLVTNVAVVFQTK